MSFATTGAGLEKVEAEIEKIAAETGVSKATVYKISKDIDYLEQQIQTSKTQADLNNTANFLKDVLIKQGQLDIEKAEVMLKLLKMEENVYDRNPKLKTLEVGTRAGGGTLGLQGVIGGGSAELLQIIENIYNYGSEVGGDIGGFIDEQFRSLNR